MRLLPTRFLFALALIAMLVVVRAGEPDYSPYTDSYHLPFGNRQPVDFAHLESLSVRASLDGAPPMRLQVDTGSTGVIVSASEVPHIEPDAPAGSITYSSSGVELIGVWTHVTMSFPDTKDAQGRVATAVVPVLAVRERKVHPGAVNSSGHTPSLNPKVHMLGIGSGRGKETHQDRNPWLNLDEMKKGTMRRGYIIAPGGITLGLSAGAVGEGYLFEKLREHTAESPSGAGEGEVKDWESARGWVEVAGAKSEEAGMLLDTGLTNMTVQAPNPGLQGEVPDGTSVTVHLLGGRLSYSFAVGDAMNPAAPRKVTWVRKTAHPLVNTGLRALALFDYLYDADGGYCGLRPRAGASGN